MRRIGWMVAIASCGLFNNGAEEPAIAWTEFSTPQLQGIETRFRQQEPFEASEAQRAEAVASCPVLRRAQAVQETESFWLVTLQGERLDGVRFAATLPDGTLADAVSREVEGSVQLPIGCERCTIIAGVKLQDGRHVACLGPGYSFTLDAGQLTSP